MKIPASPEVEIREVSSADELLAARRFHGHSYLDAGYVGQLSAEGVVDDPWVDHSKYFVAVHTERDAIVGVCRFILNSPASFPIFNEFELAPEWQRRFSADVLENSYEVSALAAGGGLQHSLVAGLFYRQTVRYSTHNPESSHLLAAMDYRLLRLLRRWMHLPFHQIGEPRQYMGSKTVPVYGFMPELIASVAAHDEAEAEYLMDGRSFDEIGDLVIDLRESAVSITEPAPEVESA
ncbi:MAG: N-acyl amino acid synthase FeeM domain-containing protein [Acidimicrobiales bacterium]